MSLNSEERRIIVNLEYEKAMDFAKSLSIYGCSVPADDSGKGSVALQKYM